MSMTQEEYNNLKVGDLVLFDINTPFSWDSPDSCQTILDGKPHQIIDAGIEDGFYRLKFNEVKSNPYKLGWYYYNYLLYMTKVPPPKVRLILTKENLIGKKIYFQSYKEYVELLKIADKLGFVWGSGRSILLERYNHNWYVREHPTYLLFNQCILWG